MSFKQLSSQKPGGSLDKRLPSRQGQDDERRPKDLMAQRQACAAADQRPQAAQRFDLNPGQGSPSCAVHLCCPPALPALRPYTFTILALNNRVYPHFTQQDTCLQGSGRWCSLLAPSSNNLTSKRQPHICCNLTFLYISDM